MSEKLGRAEVERIAQLARLRLSEEEIRRFAGQLARVLDYAETVQQVDTSGVPPTSHPVADAAGHMREDHSGRSLARNEVIAGAPDADPAAGLFKVPRVL